jgi:AcrR family transcriptional regulator
MRSIRTGPEVEDRTTQAKIRDAAIARFPVDGLNGTTVRAIAKDAGVSPALVIHHFGSKDGLHRACDEHVVRLMMEMKAESIKDGTYRQSSATAAAYRMAEGPLRYLAWTLGTGTETASRIFDDLLDEATELLVESKGATLTGEIYGDPRKQAAVLVSMQMSSLILHDHLTRAFDVDTLTADGLMAMAPYALQIYSGELFDQDVIAQTREALTRLETAQEEVK